MAKPKVIPCLVAWGMLPLALFGGACSSDIATVNGSCVSDSTVDCTVSLTGDTPQDVGLSGYSCSGAARPDQDARYIEGIPQGIVCADRGAPSDGKQAYCCSKNITTCAYDPVSSCDPGRFGYECRGSSRPEALNAAISCGNGVDQGDYIDYCCTGQPHPLGCKQLNTLGCPGRLTGFLCSGTELPKAEEFGVSESRADYYRPLCPIPTPSADPTQEKYCCYMPALVPVGGTCVQDTTVPGCAGGRFGFACYGPDTPDQDYLPMLCPDPGFSGKSAEGYPATLYCCDFQ